MDAVLGVRARWGKPTNTNGSCDALVSKLRILDAGGLLAWRGNMKLNYSRTWFEVGSGNSNYQVWRFLANGDLRHTSTAGPAPCPVPSCAAAHGRRVRFTGYVDWALDCATGQWSNAWMLNHGCDLVDHAPGFPRGGPFHPDRAYTFVGPAAGFAVSPMVPGEGGGGPFEAVRKIRMTTAAGAIGPAVCEFEERVQHSMQPIAQYCVCAGSANNPPQWQENDLFIGGNCGTTIFTGGVPGLLPGYLSMGIGTWTDPTKYPGPEAVRWNIGEYTVIDGCTNLTQQEVYLGATTLGGFPAHAIDSTGIATPLPPIFVDQANALDRAGAILMNVPYYSSRIVNLNH